jgi:hypothetical protein
MPQVHSIDAPLGPDLAEIARITIESEAAVQE